MKLKTMLVLGVMLNGLLTGCKDGASFYVNNLRSQSFVQPDNTNRYDFLWVLDNSGSMKPRRDYVRDGLSKFLSILNSRKAIDYQMAATTTDAFKDFGKLVSSANGKEVVKSSSSLNPAADFSDIINSVQDSNTSFWEQGLENSYLAILKNGTKFMRKGVPLIVVYLTDEEDFSCKESCWGSEPENNTNWKGFELERYIDLFKELKKGEGAEIVLFPIIGVNSDRCAVPSLGARYQAVAEAVGLYGKVGSICDVDLETSYNNIAQVIADRGNVFPIDVPALRTSIKVYVDRAQIDSLSGDYEFDSKLNAVVFKKNIPKAGSQIEILFEEAKN